MWKKIGGWAIKLAVWAINHQDTVDSLVKAANDARKK